MLTWQRGCLCFWKGPAARVAALWRAVIIRAMQGAARPKQLKHGSPFPEKQLRALFPTSRSSHTLGEDREMTKDTNAIELNEQDLEGVIGGGVILVPILGSTGPGDVRDSEPQGLTPGLDSSRGD